MIIDIPLNKESKSNIHVCALASDDKNSHIIVIFFFSTYRYTTPFNLHPSLPIFLFSLFQLQFSPFFTSVFFLSFNLPFFPILTFFAMFLLCLFCLFFPFLLYLIYSSDMNGFQSTDAPAFSVRLILPSRTRVRKDSVSLF